MVPKLAPKLKHFIVGSGLAAVAICILPIVADSFGATQPAPAFQINRALKNDRLMVPNMTVAKRKAPVETARQTPDESRPPVPRKPEDATKTKILDGCEPAFSSVTMPTLAHIAGRCIG